MAGRVAKIERRGGVSRLQPVLARLGAAGLRTPELLVDLGAEGWRTEAIPARAVIQEERAPRRRPRWLLTGWACRCRYLTDGRRQIFDVILPGEGVGVCVRPRPVAVTTTLALTAVELLDAGEALRPVVLEVNPELEETLERLADEDERRLLDQVVRLGRMSALERTAHFLLELHARMSVIGQAEGERFPLPLTQEVLADILSLSAVHANRTLQELRRQRLATVERGWAALLDRDGLERLAHRS